MQDKSQNAYFRGISGCLVDVYAMLYAKMFHGYDIMKHCDDHEIRKKQSTIIAYNCRYLYTFASPHRKRQRRQRRQRRKSQRRQRRKSESSQEGIRPGNAVVDGELPQIDR